MVKNTLKQFAVALPVAFATGLYALICIALNQLNIEIPSEVSGLVWA